jgi:hypothetical protein
MSASEICPPSNDGSVIDKTNIILNEICVVYYTEKTDSFIARRHIQNSN